MESKNFKAGDIEFTIPKWPMSKQLTKQGVVLPILSGPLSTALAYKDNVEDNVFQAAMVAAIMEALSEVDMNQVCATLFDGVAYRNESGVPELLTVNKLDEIGIGTGELYLLVAAIIKVNYGGLLKNDLGDSLTSLMEL